MDELDNFKYLYIDNHASKTLFLLHGTGGDEKDLLSLVTSVRSKYNIVGLKGNVSEQGMARFFRRFETGKFDQENILQETEKLAQFLSAWYDHYQLKAEQTAFVGYSNGANMILAMLFRFPDLVHKAAVLHSMLPFEPTTLDLTSKKLLVTYGEHDQMITAVESQKVAETLTKLGAEVEVITHPGGHEVQRVEVAALEQFLRT